MPAWRSLQASMRRRQGLSDRRAPAIASEITDPAQERESQRELDMAPIDVQMNLKTAVTPYIPQIAGRISR